MFWTRTRRVSTVFCQVHSVMRRLRNEYLNGGGMREGTVRRYIYIARID